MTKLLQDAIDQVSKAPEDCQNLIGSLILQELADDAAWERAFAKRPEKLAKLAAEARAEHEAGLTEPLDFSDL